MEYDVRPKVNIADNLVAYQIIRHRYPRLRMRLPHGVQEAVRSRATPPLPTPAPPTHTRTLYDTWYPTGSLAGRPLLTGPPQRLLQMLISQPYLSTTEQIQRMRLSDTIDLIEVGNKGRGLEDFYYFWNNRVLVCSKHRKACAWTFRPSQLSVPRWVEVAAAEMGVAEQPGRRHNARILEYHDSVTSAAAFNADEVPWCASFVNWCMEQSGLSGPQTASYSLNWRDWGQGINQPAFGCIAVFRRSGGGHIGFVVGKVTRHRVRGRGRSRVREQYYDLALLGGNQSDRVSVMQKSTSQLVAYRIPDNYIVPEDNQTLREYQNQYGYLMGQGSEA